MSGIAILKGFLMVVEVLSAFLLIIIILMQKSKSQGMGLAFGGAMGESLFGAQMGNVLTKATVVLAIVFMVNTTILAMLGPIGGEPKTIADTISDVPGSAPMDQPMQSQVPMSPPVEGTTPAIPTVPIVPAPVE